MDLWPRYIGSDYAQKLFSWIASGDPPENLRTGTQYFPTLWADDVLLPLTEYFNRDADLLDDAQYMTELYDIYTMDDELFATVIGPNVMAAYLNMDMLAEAGLSYPDEDWTYEDYAAMAVAHDRGRGHPSHLRSQQCLLVDGVGKPVVGTRRRHLRCRVQPHHLSPGQPGNGRDLPVVSGHGAYPWGRSHRGRGRRL